MVIKGQLVPYDNVEGCKFIIDVDNKQNPPKAFVKIFSPFGGELLDSAKMNLDKVENWLYNRKDW